MLAHMQAEGLPVRVVEWSGPPRHSPATADAERAPSSVDCAMQSTWNACSPCVVIVDLKATMLAASVSTEARLPDADHVPLLASRITQPGSPTRYSLISNHDGSRTACLRAIASKLLDDREADAVNAAPDAVW